MWAEDKDSKSPERRPIVFSTCVMDFQNCHKELALEREVLKTLPYSAEEGCVITHFLRRSRLLYFSTAPLNSSTDTESSACGTIALTFLLMASNFAFTGSLDMWSFIFYGSKKITVKDSIIWPRALTMTLKQHYWHWHFFQDLPNSKAVPPLSHVLLTGHMALTQRHTPLTTHGSNDTWL